MSKVTVEERIQVQASPDTAWALLGDFGGLPGWFPVVTASRVVGNGVGAVRHLTMPDGNVLEERQETRDEAQRRYSYTVIGGPVPFTGYRSELRVAAAPEGCEVVWSASFEPLAGAPMDPVAFIRGAYRAGLESAKARLEG